MVRICLGSLCASSGSRHLSPLSMCTWDQGDIEHFRKKRLKRVGYAAGVALATLGGRREVSHKAPGCCNGYSAFRFLNIKY